MSHVRRCLLPALCALILPGCGDAVTNPALEGFGSDPRVIQGDWVTVQTRFGQDPLLLQGELIPAGGTIIGSFDFHRFGQFWSVRFNDGTWDGTQVKFDVTMTIAEATTRVDWTATYEPPANGEPARLLLASAPFGGDVSPIEYLRPEDVEER